jgi:hypothetical protein
VNGGQVRPQEALGGVRFHAGFVDVDERCRRISFADRNDETGEHYFIMGRSEQSPDEAIPDMDNVYIERDDQGWAATAASSG